MIHEKTTVTAEQAGRADGVVRTLVKKSRSEVRGLFSLGCVSLNGTVCTDINAMVKSGDKVDVRFDPHQRHHERRRAWEDDNFEIVFEDEHLIVVDKTAGVLTVPANPGDKNTLIHAVELYFKHRGVRERPQLVHRLDRDVSGLLIFGKTREVAEKLQNQFEARKPERLYYALVKGVVEEEGTFESYLATATSHQRYSTKIKEKAELAITHFKREQVLDRASWVRVWLETGRRNQIRVQFADAGHPVLGDPRYRADLSDHPRWKSKRLALHAAMLGFDHPETRKPLKFQSKMPAVMRIFIEQSKGNAVQPKTNAQARSQMKRK